MTKLMKDALTVGQRVRDGLGHWYVVVEVPSPWRYRVEPVRFPSH